jgi:hypothetical protein
VPGLTTLDQSAALYQNLVLGAPDAGVGGVTGAVPMLPPIQPLDPAALDMTTLAGHQALYDGIDARWAAMNAARLAPPLIQLWDGGGTLRGQCEGYRDVDYEFIENDTGICTLRLSLQHYLARWVMNFQGRAKRNVIITIDKQGSRWSGIMDHYVVVSKKNNDAYVDVIFKHDYEQVKHILCWANPFLTCDVQFPKLWIIFGPSKWCLLMTLFVNVFRLESAIWAIPDDPLDPMSYLAGLDMSTWRNIVKPFPFLSDSSNTTIVFSRFKTWHDLAKPILASAQLTVIPRRYLAGVDPHPFASLQGELGVESVEQLFELIPIRNMACVWDIVDNSGWANQTAFGGSLLTGLLRAYVSIASDGYTQGVNVFEGDPTYPDEYYTPLFLGTSPEAPWVVYDGNSNRSGVQETEFTYFEATDTNFVVGGKSMPGVNEGISALVNMGGDFVTSILNSIIGAVPKPAFFAEIDFDIDIPPLGGVIDSLAKILYEDTFLAFDEVPTLRESGETYPLPGLEDLSSGLGDFHLFEKWCEGADRANTLSAVMAVVGGIWDTRTRYQIRMEISDAAPYLIGEPGWGHYWLGNRVGTTMPGFPSSDVIFVERVTKIKYGWGVDGSRGWEIFLGYEDPQNPAVKALNQIKDINAAASTMGIL